MLTARSLCQHPNERIILLLRRHPFTVLRRILPHTLLFLAPFLLVPLARNSFPAILPEPGTPGYAIAVLAGSAYLLVVLLLLFLRWVDYVLDLWVVTTDRIVNIKQNELFHRVISEQMIERVQDVTSEVHGTMATLLNFGNVIVQTAGEEARFVFEEVSHPEEIVHTILKLHDEAVRRQGRQTAKPQQP